MEINKLNLCQCGKKPELERIPCGVTRNLGVRYMVKCYNCRRSTGYKFNEKDAVEQWNETGGYEEK